MEEASLDSFPAEPLASQRETKDLLWLPLSHFLTGDFAALSLPSFGPLWWPWCPHDHEEPVTRLVVWELP